MDQVAFDVPLPQLIQAAPCTTWSVADISNTLRYVRGCQALDLPEEYKPLYSTFPWEFYDPVEVPYWESKGPEIDKVYE